MLRTVRSVIVDELHAVAGSKRGAHLALSLERPDALCDKPPLRIGLSATPKPLDTMAGLFMGPRGRTDETGLATDRDHEEIERALWWTMWVHSVHISMVAVEFI